MARVTVLMPVYNNAMHLRQALESVLGQSYRDFELLLFDDGSTDGSREAIKDVARRDARVRPHFSDANCGYTHWLNVGLKEAQGEFIARMDADDVAERSRFLKQVCFFDKNPNLVLLGSWVRWIDKKGRPVRIKRMPETDGPIRWTLALDNPFVHPSVMFRRSVVGRHGLRFDPSYQPTEDYRFWAELLKYGKGRNLREPLLRYRLHDKQISTTQRERQLANHDRTVEYIWREVLNLEDPGPDMRVALRKFAQGELLESIIQKVLLREFLDAYFYLLGKCWEMCDGPKELKKMRYDALGRLSRSIDKGSNWGFRASFFMELKRRDRGFAFFYIRRWIKRKLGFRSSA
jgi:glycosyltransferase involved in cell wall biosynthesis